jgi:hypothetical protein
LSDEYGERGGWVALVLAGEVCAAPGPERPPPSLPMGAAPEAGRKVAGRGGSLPAARRRARGRRGERGGRGKQVQVYAREDAGAGAAGGPTAAADGAVFERSSIPHHQRRRRSSHTGPEYPAHPTHPAPPRRAAPRREPAR